MELKDFIISKGLDASLADKFAEMMKLALEWNEKINITAIKTPEDFINKNIIDSLTLLGRPELASAEKILDLGTGGGYPGLPLALANPDKQFVLMDSVGKKLTVVSAIAFELGITNVKTVHARAEDLARNKAYREGFDLVVSRAVAALPALCEYCIPFVKKNGYFVAYKTETAQAELEDAKRAISKLGGGRAECIEDGISGSGHIFISIKKLSNTPAAYPRKAGLPTKEPL